MVIRWVVLCLRRIRIVIAVGVGERTALTRNTPSSIAIVCKVVDVVPHFPPARVGRFDVVVLACAAADEVLDGVFEIGCGEIFLNAKFSFHKFVRASLENARIHLSNAYRSLRVARPAGALVL